jgi:hypothetical protein
MGNVPIEHHPTIRYMVYNGYYKVMSNIPKMGQLPTPVICVAFTILYTQFTIILPTNAACCPDIYIEDVVLLNKIGGIAENTAYTQSFLV